MQFEVGNLVSRDFALASNMSTPQKGFGVILQLGSHTLSNYVKIKWLNLPLRSRPNFGRSIHKFSWEPRFNLIKIESIPLDIDKHS